jgi:hypothetical protein
VTASDVRPSAIGEILDRAIATYVRRFVPLFVILALIGVPVGIFGALASPGLTHVFQMFNQISALPPGDLAGRTKVLNDFNRAAAPGGLLALFYLLEFAFYPLARTALVIFAAQTLDGAAPTVGTAYRAALARWLPQLAVGIAFVAIGTVFAIVFAVTGAFVALAVFAVALLSRIAGIVAGVALGIAVVAAVIVVVAMTYTAWLMASVSVSIEDPNPVRAVGRGLRRTFDRPLLRRTLGVALAVVAIDWFGSLALLTFSAAVEYFTHVTLLYAIVTACAAILLDGVRTIFVLIYMRDVKLRREGTDLLLAAAAPSPAM